MTTCRGADGFSLVEVVIAVAVLAVSVAGVLALLPVVTRQTNEASESLVAHGMAGAIETELNELARRDGWAAFSARFEGGESAAGMALVASRQGDRISAAETSALPPAEQFFLVEISKLEAMPSAATMADSESLAVQAKVSWPYRLPAANGESVETNPQQRAIARFLMSVKR